MSDLAVGEVNGAESQTILVAQKSDEEGDPGHEFGGDCVFLAGPVPGGALSDDGVSIFPEKDLDGIKGLGSRNGTGSWGHSRNLMHRNLKLLLLLPLAFALVGCPPTSGPGPNPPTMSWAVFDNATQRSQTFGQNGEVHLTGGTFTLSFFADAPGGLTSMKLTAEGNVEGSADNGTGGTFTNGFHTVSLPPQSTTFNPAVTSSSLLITSFDFFKIDTHSIVNTDNGPKEGFADKGTITLTGTATDTSGRTSTGQLQIQVP
jgi:hypothetical protein